MDNCKYCKKFNPKWRNFVRKNNRKFTLRKINGPEHTKLLKKYDVKQFPTIVVVTGNEYKHVDYNKLTSI